ncbi:MAG: multiheme c-type cytochrome, partial [Planctomycetota bacterium]
MKYVKVFLTLFVITGIIFGIAACKRSTEQTVEEEPLLLLDELEPSEASEQSGPVADNSRCYVCHMNFDGEGLSAMHAKHDVSCEDCHGASDEHCSDEDNITPPDKMFAK